MTSPYAHPTKPPSSARSGAGGLGLGLSSGGGFTLSPSLTEASDSDSGGGDSDSDAPLPFPTALPRADFVAPGFDAAAYLSATMPHRFQTLEDLRGDLRERSAAVSAELLELVNANYASFLGLGDELQGGEDRVEDVRVSLLGFRRAVDEVRARVATRGAEVAGLSEDLGAVRAEIERGRKMLELEERVAGLEGRLAVGSMGKEAGGVAGWGAADSAESEDEDGEVVEGFLGGSPGKLMALAKDYVAIERLAESVGPEIPFVRKMEERMIRCRNTLLLDLRTAIKEAKRAGPRGEGRLLKYMGIYRVLGAPREATKALKEK